MGKLYFTMLIVLLPVMMLASAWTIGQSGCDFTTIQEAIDDIYNVVNSGDTFRVQSGTYGPLVFNDEGFTIEASAGSEVYISGNFNNRAIEIENYSSDITVFIGLTIKNGTTNSDGGGVYSPTERVIKFIDCTIEDCQSDDDGGGVYCKGNMIMSDSQIEDCEAEFRGGGIFIDDGILNITDTNINECNANYAGGGVALYDTSTLNMEGCCISNCYSNCYTGGLDLDLDGGVTESSNIINSEFINCGANVSAGAIWCQRSIAIKGCTFNYNHAPVGSAIFLSSGISIAFELFDSIFSNNCIVNPGNTSSTIDLSVSFSSTVDIGNVTISNNTNIGGVYQGILIDEYLNCEVSLRNSIIRDLSSHASDCEYCCLWNGATGYDATCFIADPLFVNEANDDYHLSWDSPCIDAGDPDNDGDYEYWLFDEDDQDADGSRLDLGCYYYEQDRWEFEDDEIVWMSFPQLPCDYGVNNGGQVDASDVFGRFEETTIPDIYLWQESDITGTECFKGEYENYTYTWTPSNYSFNSTDGLKIIVNNDNDPINPLISGGLACELTTSVSVTTEPGNLNWVGYFLPYTSLIWNAFDEDTLDKLTFIRTENWTAYKFKDKWYYAIQYGNLTLSYGDMVELKTSEEDDFTFCWQSFGSSGESYDREKTIYFDYEEELDYQSIFVELGEEIPDEIAVFIDGVCKGAEVVDTDSLIEIRAYVLEEPDGEEIEIFTANGRSTRKCIEYCATDESGNMKDRHIFTQHNKDYQWVSLKSGSDVPESEKVLTCYPNPFNPELTIVYLTTEHSEYTEINIYNIKGQKVKTLCNAALPAGEHLVIWQGRDESGKQVSSGVYFIRMQVGQKVYTEKAVLMK